MIYNPKLQLPVKSRNSQFLVRNWFGISNFSLERTHSMFYNGEIGHLLDTYSDTCV